MKCTYPGKYLLAVACLICGAGWAEVTIERLYIHGVPALPVEEAPRPVSVSEVTVTTAWYPLYYFAERLAQGTAIRVIDGAYEAKGISGCAPEEPACFARWLDHLPGTPHFDGVLTIRSANPDDAPPAQPALKGALEIDVTSPHAQGGTGIALLRDEKGEPRWRWFWLSLANLSRMSEIMATGLSTLSPPDAAQIQSNLNRIKGELLTIGQYMSRETALLANTEVQLVFPGGEYLMQSMGLNVIARCQKDVSPASKAPLFLLFDVGQACTPLLDDSRNWIPLDSLLERTYGKIAERDLLTRYRENVEKIVSSLRQP